MLPLHLEDLEVVDQEETQAQMRIGIQPGLVPREPPAKEILAVRVLYLSTGKPVAEVEQEAQGPRQLQVQVAPEAQGFQLASQAHDLTWPVVVVDQTMQFQQTHLVADWAAVVQVETYTDRTALPTLAVEAEVAQIVTAQTATPLLVEKAAQGWSF
jgi:hypothetical protein